MLQSAQIQRRQSEIRESLAELAANDSPSDDETRSMDSLDKEYRANETRYRAALTAEDAERREAGNELETRDNSEWSDLVGRFELRQAALYLDEGKVLDGATAEVVQELRSAGGFRGVPVPLQVLETRAGETTASGVPDPVGTRPIVPRLFPNSVAASMGANLINIGSGQVEFPICTSAVTAGWAGSETGDVAGPTRYTTTDRALKPEHNLGVTMHITRRALKQSGGLESAIRRDMTSAIQAEMDRAVFQGAGANGEPLGVISGADTYGIASTAVDAAATWAAFRSAVTTFVVGNAAGGPSAVRVMIRPEVWDSMDAAIFDAGSGITEYSRLTNAVGNVTMTSNGLEAPSGSPEASTALLTTSAGGQSPIYVGLWGALDLVRDIYTDAASGGLRLTALTTMDVSVSRTEQLQVLTGVQ